MNQIFVQFLTLFFILFGLALMVGGPRLGGQVIGGAMKWIIQIFGLVVQIAAWIPLLLLKVAATMLGGGLRWLTKPRQREPRY